MNSDRIINTGGGDIIGSIGRDYIKNNKGTIINQSGSTNKSNIYTQNISSNINKSQDEVLQLIECLSKQISNLDNKIMRNEALEYLDDVEIEVSSSTPKKSKLKASLTILWNTVKDIALIANAVTALAQRLGIQLPHLS